MGLRDRLVDDDGISRRELFVGTGALTIGFGGGVFFNGASFPAKDLAPYIAKQGKLRWEINPISYKDWTIGEFYEYTASGGQSADFPLDLSLHENASRMFVYDGPVADSLAFYHGSSEALSGGTAFFKFSGLSRSQGQWAVRDDPMSVDDDFEKWEGGNAKVKWEWGPRETDGGAYWGVLDENKVKVYPKTLRGVDGWYLLTDTGAGIRRIELAEDTVYISQPSRPVREIQMDIMPNSKDNVFDPYAKRTIKVVLSDGKEADPANLDPGNYSVNFGSKDYLAGGNAAEPQNYYRKNGKLYLEFKLNAAHFNLDSDYGYVMTKATDGAWVRGRDAVNPGGKETSGGDQPLSLYGYKVDADGDDAKNLNDEWIDLKNTSGSPTDMTGWTVEDSDNKTFTFPDGFTLPAGETVTIHSGSGSNTTTDLYWGANKPVWQNGGDRIIVKNPSNKIVIYHLYPSG